MEKLLVIAVIVIMVCFTFGQYHRDGKIYDCRIEALKALQDPIMIKQICGELND
jgi:hypothetical protein